MLSNRHNFWMLFLIILITLFPLYLSAQNFNATLSGVVTDPRGDSIPGAQLILTSNTTNSVAHAVTNSSGSYVFPNLAPAPYTLRVSAKGFRDYVQRGIVLLMNQKVAADVHLQLGTAVQTVEVSGNASPLNYATPTLKGAINPQTINALPLIVSGTPRSAATFVVLLPGVTTGGSGDAFNSRVNGGLEMGGDATLDGVSEQEGLMSQSGMVAADKDWPMSPDMVQEMSVVEGNYSVQYGNSSSMVINMVTKSGTNQLHGGGFEYLRNTALNAAPWGSSQKGVDQEHEFGGDIGGPARLPGLWSHFMKTYFYVNLTGYRINGGVSLPVLTVPTSQERAGDFSDWKDSSGNLIPIYDPATTKPNPAYNPNQPTGANNLPYLRQQFPGNVIPASDLTGSLANAWLKLEPLPNLPGVVNNWRPPQAVPDIILSHTNYLDIRMDHYILDKDHVSYSIYYQGAHALQASYLPLPESNTVYAAPEYTFVDRFNWDHTFGPTVLNNARFGYNNRMEGYGGLDTTYAKQFPAIPGLPNIYPPRINFSNSFQSFGTGQGPGADDVTARPAYVANDMLTWVKGSHTLIFGGEYRNEGMNIHSNANRTGTFNFSTGETGLIGINSGSPIASFLLGEVDSSNAFVCSECSVYPRSYDIGVFAGDTWKATKKLSVTYGLRWDKYDPAADKWNRLSFVDPNMPNPGASNRLGALAFAGTGWGSASFGRRTPEIPFNLAFAPRIGIAYTVTPNTVIRTGYGIFFDQAFYPGWGGGSGADGFQLSPTFSSSLGGLNAAFLLQNGFPQNFTHPPDISNTYDNGQYPGLYRPFTGNRLPYSQQWNFTVEHSFTNNFYVNVGYVGNHAIRLASSLDPLSAVNPSHLSMGSALYDTFQPGQASLDGVAAPYPGWAAQMTACSPTVAQALMPYPQFCGNIFGLNENEGWSHYNSLQVKAEKRFSHGLWSLTSYTWSKTLTTSQTTQSTAQRGSVNGIISPFFPRADNYGLAFDDVPQNFSEALTYDLPIGKGQRFFSGANSLVGRLLSGWEVSTVLRASSGLPQYFRSNTFCNIPGQFAMGCIPGILPGTSPFVTNNSFSNLNTSLPMYNAAALQPASAFNFNPGNGSIVTNYRGPGYHNQDIALIKDTRITERIRFEVRAELFNAWNWHTFNCAGEQDPGCLAFNNDVSSPGFGLWNGNVTNPRDIQLAARLTF
ncbi:MAG: carboxypeptidase regulatory-like domain-containing protein [Terriglobia bacterium]